MGPAGSVLFLFIIAPIWYAYRHAGKGGVVLLLVMGVGLWIVSMIVEAFPVMGIVFPAAATIGLLTVGIYCTTHKEQIAKSQYENYKRQQEKEKAKWAAYRQLTGIDKEPGKDAQDEQKDQP